MSPVTLAGFALSTLFLVSHSATASSIGLAHDELRDSLTSSRLSLSGEGSTKTRTAQTLPSNTWTVDASSLQFGSSIVETVAGSPRLTATSTAGKSLGIATAFLVGRSAASPRCIVEAIDPAPSVAPESSSALLFGLGLAALTCVGCLRGWTLGHRD